MEQTLRDPQSLNSYNYGNGNPINNKDPEGKSAYPYLMVGVAAYDATVVWDFGADVISNMQNPGVPWYGKLTPQDPNAALRYNADAYGNAAVAIASFASSVQLKPLVQSGYLTPGGANVISASVAGLGNVVISYARGQLKTDSSSSGSQKAGQSFITGFFGTRIGQKIPDPSGPLPSTLSGSMASAHALTEQYRAQADQATQATFARLFPSQVATLKSQSGQQDKKK
jgi:hypothetical protein